MVRTGTRLRPIADQGRATLSGHFAFCIANFAFYIPCHSPHSDASRTPVGLYARDGRAGAARAGAVRAAGDAAGTLARAAGGPGAPGAAAGAGEPAPRLWVGAGRGRNREAVRPVLRARRADVLRDP